MPTSQKKFYLTTSIPYVNGQPHIGFALELVYADVLARYWRNNLGAKQVRFTTGTDEHGQKNFRAAESLHITPQQYVDRMAEKFYSLLAPLNISYDDFVRTSSSRHKKTAQKFWQKLVSNGDIFLGTYEGLYCVGCEANITEKDLTEGKCAIHQLKPEVVKERNYFFKLSKYQERLLNLYNDHPNFVVPPHRYREIKNIVRSGLEDVSISREYSRLSWGVPVPGDEQQVMYVWFEALLNYLTSIGFGDKEDEFNKWWPADLHIIGKDINRFHTILWPAMLIAANIPLSHQIAVHGFISVDGQKMSKTLGNVVDPLPLIELYSTDAVRYYLLKEIPFNSDGDFSPERFEAVYTADLSNGLGNLLSRVTNMIEKYCAGVLNSCDHGEAKAILGEKGKKLEKDIKIDLDKFQFDQALKKIWRVVEKGNLYIEQQKPWKLVKDNPEKLREVLEQLLFWLNCITGNLSVFLPQTSQKIKKILRGKKIMKCQPLFSNDKRKIQRLKKF